MRNADDISPVRQTPETAMGLQGRIGPAIPKELEDAVALTIALDERYQKNSPEWLHGAFSGLTYALQATRNIRDPRHRIERMIQIATLLGGHWLQAMEEGVDQKLKYLA